MLDAISQITISEVILLFVLLFVLPGMGYLVFNLRKYEKMAGRPPATEKKKKKKKDEPPPPPPAPKKVPDNVFPYRTRPLLSPPERACLIALREVMGADYDVFAKTALWERIEPTDQDPGYAERLRGLAFDFLICDRDTGEPLTAIMFNPGKGKPAGPADLLRKICEAAGVHAVFIDLAEQYDAKKLKEALGIPDIDL
jgi:hypothetical protein